MMQYSQRMNNKPSIFFRADGNIEKGWGHVFRCLALIEHLCDEFNCIFCIYQPDAFIKKILL